MKALHKHFPDLPNVPVGNSDTRDAAGKNISVVDGSEAKQVLGLE